MNSGNNKLEELHANPDNLIFYLIKGGFSTLNFEIIKKINLDSVFGNIELAIIGSSHYFRLGNIFTEIITCAREKPKTGQLILSKTKHDEFHYLHNFKTFEYETKLKTTAYPNTEAFTGFEKSLLKKESLFLHAFSKDSDITALHYQNTESTFLLQTWHTYPKFNKVIYSITSLQVA